VQIGRDAGKEAAAMKAIAVVTMTFLPATFVSVCIRDCPLIPDAKAKHTRIDKHYLEWGYSPLNLRAVGRAERSLSRQTFGYSGQFPRL
jgi:hypothetical protein